MSFDFLIVHSFIVGFITISFLFCFAISFFKNKSTISIRDIDPDVINWELFVVAVSQMTDEMDFKTVDHNKVNWKDEGF